MFAPFIDVAPRRRILKTLSLFPALGVLGLSACSSLGSRAPSTRPKEARWDFEGDAILDLVHAHTGETLRVEFRSKHGYVHSGLKKLNHFMRDFRTGEVVSIDPKLVDFLHAVKQRVGGGRIQILSAYRSPKTNKMLRKAGKGAAKKSLHMLGRALDFMIEGVSAARLNEAAIDLKRGGVGYYPRSGFIHIDTGAFRTWRG